MTELRIRIYQEELNFVCEPMQKNNWKMTVDGYVLGQSIHYDSGGLLNTARSCDADLLFYAESFETAAEAATRFHLIRKE